MWPDPTAVFRRADYVQLRTADGAEAVWDGRRWVEVPHASALLARFVHPRSPAGVVDEMLAGCRTRDEALAVVSSLGRLVESGALISADGASLTPPRGPRLEERDFHGSLLADRVRVEAFVGAVRALVRPGDVVVDAGTGSGVLALAAAAAGAARVYAIERGPMADIAAAVFRANAVDDRVTLIRGDARTVTLPEPAHVLLSETIGANPYNEGILEILSALRPQLAPGARVLPRAITTRAAPLSIPDNVLRAWMPHASDLAVWCERYGFDLAALDLPDWPRGSSAPLEWVSMWMMSRGPVAVNRLPLSDPFPASVEGASGVEIVRAGVVNAVAIGFELDLADAAALDSWAVDRRSPSWDLATIRLPDPVAVQQGDELRITVVQPATGALPTVRAHRTGETRA